MDFDVLVHQLELPPHGAAPTAPMTGEEANIRIRRLVVNSMADELWTYEVPDRDGNPLRIVARTQRTENMGLDGPRVAREVYEQRATGGPVHELDWLERGEYQTPKPTTQPVKVGEEVWAMSGGVLKSAEVTSIEWKVSPMQSHYQLPPLWTWEWRVEIQFADGHTTAGRWHSDWISRNK